MQKHTHVQEVKKMLKKTTQLIIALLMLVQILVPMTTTLANETEKYEFNYEENEVYTDLDLDDTEEVYPDIENELTEDEAEIPELEDIEVTEPKSEPETIETPKADEVIPEVAPEDNSVITPTTNHTITLESAMFAGNNTNPSRPQGTPVSIHAVIPAGHRFVRWQTSIPVFEPGINGREISYITNTSITLVVPNQDVTITAVTRANPRVTFVGARFGTNWSAASYRNPVRLPGSTFDIAAVAPTGYRFVRWQTSRPVFEAGWNGRNINHVRNTSIRVIMPEQDVTITAIFTRRAATSPTTNRRLPGVIRNNHVELRRGPGTSYDLRDELSRGTEVIILNEGRNGWRYVRVAGSNARGWVRGSQITGSTTFGIVTGNRVALREGVNSGRTLRHLSRDTNITILGTNGNQSWTQVRSGNQTGWVRTSQIRNLTQIGRVIQSAHLRQGPGNEFPTVRGSTSLTVNTDLQVLGRRGSWIRVRVGSQTGWMQRSATRRLRPVRRARRQVQLRRGPGTNFAQPRNGRVGRNARVRVLAHRGSWSRVQVGTRTGWVRTSQLR